MIREVVANTGITISGNVWDVATAKPKTSGTIYGLIRLSKTGDSDHGKYWDTNAGGSWQAAASVVAWPTFTYSKGSAWTYATPAGASNGKTGGYLVLDDLTDNVATPASSTVLAGCLETIAIVSALHAQTDSTIATVTDVTNVSGKVLGGGSGTITGTGVRAVDGSGNAIAPASTALSNAVWTDTKAGYVDVSVNSRLAATGYTAPANSDVAAIKLKTDLLPASPASTGDIPSASANGSAAATAILVTPAQKLKTDSSGNAYAVDSSGNAIAPASTALSTATWTGTKAGYLDASVDSRLASASYTAPPSASTNASAVRTELGPELGRIDVATGTRLASGDYTAPSNGEISAIKAKTDALPTHPAATENIPDVSSIADAVEGNLSDYLAHLDADVSDTAPASTALSTTTWTGTRASYLDALSSGVPLAVDQAVNVTKIDGAALAAHPAGLFPSSATLLSGTASAGAAGSITLAGGSATNKLYNGCLVVITGGTGAGQARTILNYVGSTKVATVTRHWAVNPSSDSVYVVIGYDVSTLLESGTSAGGASNTVTLDSNSSTTDGIYDNNLIMISSGTGAGQTRTIVGYVGSTKVAEVSPDWTTVPNTTSAYQIMPAGRVDVGLWLGAEVPTPTTAGVPTVDAAAPTADAVADAVRTELSTELAHLDADVGDCATSSGLSAAVETVTDAIGDIPSAPSADSVADAVRTELATELAHLDADVGDCATGTALSTAVGDITDAIGDIPGAPSASDVADAVWNEDLSGHTTDGCAGEVLGGVGAGSAPTAEQNADAVRSELAVELARIDVATGTRLAGSGYTAPDNAGISALATAVEGVQTTCTAIEAIVGGEGEGLLTAILQVLDEDDEPIPDVRYTIYVGSTFYCSGITDAAGAKTVPITAGTYEVRLARVGVSFDDPETIVVEEDAQTYTFTGSVVSAPAATDPTLCRVYGTLFDAGGTRQADTRVRFRVRTPGPAGDGSGTMDYVSMITNVYGYFEIDLVRGIVVEIDCPNAGYRLTHKTVPDAASQDFATW